MYYFCGQAKQNSPGGGIGRRVGLKHQWSNPCRFEPGSGYQKALFIRRAFFILLCLPINKIKV